MNERIKELARQSGLIQYDSDGKASEVEQFAELIIQECAEVIMGNEIDHPITGAVYDGDQAKAIKEHFGVKE